MYQLWLHVIRSQGVLCLKRWLWRNIKSKSWFWLQTHDMAGFEICIYTTATDRKWLPVVFTGLCRSSGGSSSCSSSSGSHEQAAVLHFKWSLSDLRATTSLWLQLRCQTIGVQIAHCTLFLIQMKRWQRWTHTHKKMKTPVRVSHGKNIVCAKEWSTEIKHNVWMYEMYLSNCCLGT